MLALVNTPSGAGPVEVREVPEPTPAANEALVEVRAFSLNRGELRLFQVRPEDWRPGQDIAGIVLKQAADGTGPAVGARVVALCDWEGWAERAAVPSHRIAPIADNVSFAAAASLPVAGLTALRALRHGAPLLGKRVLIAGAAGGVGNLAVQLAARSGVRVTAIVGRTSIPALICSAKTSPTRWPQGSSETILAGSPHCLCGPISQMGEVSWRSGRACGSIAPEEMASARYME